MLSAHGRIERGASSIASQIAMDREVQLYGVRRRGVCFDTRFVPPRANAGANESVLWIVLRGSVRWSIAGAASNGPCIWRFPGHVFDGEHGRRAITVHACGEPFEATMLRVRTTDRSDAPLEPAPLSADVHDAAEHWNACMDLDAQGESLREVRRLRAVRLLDTLARYEWIDASIHAAIASAEFGRLGDFWRGIERSFRALDAGASVKLLAAESRLSLRSFERLIVVAQQDLLSPLGGWRDSVRTLRIRLAVMFLSSPSLPIAEVAKAVGYARPQAMANAFQHAGLPSPHDVRRLVAIEHERV